MEEILRFEHVSYAYEEEREALLDVCVKVCAGERVAVLGSNGAGKSTFFLLANGVLRPGMDIPDAARASLEAAAGSASAKERAVRILSAATVSRAELEHRLRQKGESPENARQAVEWLAGLSLLDDGAAARQIVRSGAAKGYGAARIRQMLYAKHIPRELWDDAMQELPEQERWGQGLPERFAPPGPEQKRFEPQAWLRARRRLLFLLFQHRIGRRLPEL